MIQTFIVAVLASVLSSFIVALVMLVLLRHPVQKPLPSMRLWDPREFRQATQPLGARARATDAPTPPAMRAASTTPGRMPQLPPPIPLHRPLPAPLGTIPPLLTPRNESERHGAV